MFNFCGKQSSIVLVIKCRALCTTNDFSFIYYRLIHTVNTSENYCFYINSSILRHELIFFSRIIILFTCLAVELNILVELSIFGKQLPTKSLTKTFS